MIKNDFVIFGLLTAWVGLVIYFSERNKKLSIFDIFPPLLFCYFVPGLFPTFGLIDISESKVYTLVIQTLVPAALIIFTSQIRLPQLVKLGPNALLMFAASVISITLGGPIAIYFSKFFWAKEMLQDESWKALGTLAGTWIGGGANQVALKEIFKPSDYTYSAILTVDALLAYAWMALLLYWAPKSDQIDHFLKASKKTPLKVAIDKTQPSTQNLIIELSIIFSLVGLSHLLSDILVQVFAKYENTALTTSFFWVVCFSSVFGVILAIREYSVQPNTEELSQWFIYLMAAAIGLKMNILSIFSMGYLLVIAIIWLAIHIVFMFLVARSLKIPFFYVAVSSQACIGGPASAPIVAAAFHREWSSIGVILAIFGYLFGSYFGLICGELMKWVSL